MELSLLFKKFSFSSDCSKFVGLIYRDTNDVWELFLWCSVGILIKLLALELLALELLLSEYSLNYYSY